MATGLLTVPSAKAEITFPRADKDLLIFLASSRTAPSAPVLLTYQRIETAVRPGTTDSRKCKLMTGQQADPPGKPGTSARTTAIPLSLEPEAEDSLSPAVIFLSIEF